MKKNFYKILILLCVVVLVVCAAVLIFTKMNVSLDLNKVKGELSTLTKDGFNILDVESNISSINSEEIYGMEFVYNVSDYGLNEDDLEEYRFYINPENKDFYAVLKPVESKKEAVTTAMGNFINKMKMDEQLRIISKYAGTVTEEYEGYLIYIATTTLNNKILDKIKGSKTEILPMLGEVTVQDLGLSDSDVEQFLMKKSMLSTNASMYLIVKPVKAQKQKVQDKVGEYIKSVETEWSTYLQEQYNLVKNRLETKLGDYYIYVISIDNNKVLDVIKNCKE